MSYIESHLYSDIVKRLPILCADFLVSHKEKYLLIKRKQPPLANDFWLPGGRILIGESFQDVTKRILLKELSLDINDSHSIIFKGVTNMTFNSSSYGKHLYHTPALILQVDFEDLPSITLDSTSCDYSWSTSLPALFHSNFISLNSNV
jgi:ADP-ribose pyrophosphatase YjhB (NUDIX family)